ncbi:MAG: DUF3160 domain-containing protein [Ignavibacteriaceae bacterium]|nr:DUF3160 domain-containing protein [Ignavibacteriaceae bacterium]
MKTIKYSLVVVIFLFASFNLPAQSNFNIQQYKTFLQTHQNINSDGLMQMHNAGKFVGNLNLNYSTAQYFDSIAAKYSLTDAEKSSIQKNGFMVSERLSFDAIAPALIDIYKKDLPVFISTDAVLHAFHISYDRILQDVEVAVIIDSLKTLLTSMHSNIAELDLKYSSNVEMSQMLMDIDIYITVAGKLLGLSFSPYYSANISKIENVISMVNAAEGESDYSLFSTEPVTYDWSQFKPRGHYVNDAYPVLANYFRTMMWLGRIEIYLSMPRAENPNTTQIQYQDIKRGTVDAMLIKELFDISQVSTTYNYIENLLKFFVGDQDNVTIDNLGYLKNAVNLSDPADLLDSLKLITFQDTLKEQTFAYQLILSQILAENPFKPDSIIPASAFMLFGQRYVVDSYIASQVVYDKISSCRMLPSALDPMFALGNDAAAQLLKSELDTYGYSGNLAALRYLMDSYDTGYWQGSLYNLWINSIRALNPPANRDRLPVFMRTGAFWQEKLNTQLTSWAQLRHDNLLYAKQSYSGAYVICSYPYTYIEPFPELYRNMQIMAAKGKVKFDNLNITSYLKTSISQYFDYLYNVCDTLISITQKELNGNQFTDSEISFLKTVISEQEQSEGCSVVLIYNGWYPNLFYENELSNFKGFSTQDNIIADIHTAPTDCYGNMAGYVKHVGTGNINLGVFTAELPGEGLTAFIGPVLSFYEYTTSNFNRLTDQEWNDTYLASALRPSWVNAYLLDNTGNAKVEGLNLITSVVNSGKSNGQVTGNYLLVKNYPNPFNPVTTISFQIPESLSNADVELVIYNIQGRAVKHLLHKNMQTGNYLTRWDATNDAGVSVASGTYICNLRAGNMQKASKILLLK